MFGYVKRSLLDAEVDKNVDLIGQLRREEAHSAKLRSELNDAENRYLDLTGSEQYRLLEDFQALGRQLNELKIEVEAKTSFINEFKNTAIENARSEIDIQTQKLEIEARKDTKKLTDKLNAKKSDAKEGLEKTEHELSEKSRHLTEIDKSIDRKSNELYQIEANIDLQDELVSVRPISQNITGINSSETKEKLQTNKDAQKAYIRSSSAWIAHEHFYWNENLREGKSKQRRLARFLLVAFNAETDSLIGSAKKSNFHKCHKNIEKWFEKINELGEDWFVAIEREFLKLRLEELRIVVEYHLQREFEKEEEKYINQSIREEKRVQKEIENFVISREKEEKGYETEIERVTDELKASSDAEVSKLKSQIEDLRIKLERSTREKERAMSLAQLTRSGHVYIISNPGSFGHGVYKIGMTRRLDPMDRVKELGDASVPFFFDVHGIIHSDDAPGLERELHRRFSENRVNKNNLRREFFRVPIDAIEEAICEIYGHVSLDRPTSNDEKPDKGFLENED
ncbi:MAG: DUF4041 domain-containing protein [Pseudomonadales bacterium]